MIWVIVRSWVSFSFLQFFVFVKPLKIRTKPPTKDNNPNIQQNSSSVENIKAEPITKARPSTELSLPGSLLVSIFTSLEERIS